MPASSVFFSSTFQLAGGAHGGLVMTLYLPSSCCLTCCSGLRGDSLALASNTFHETLLCPLFHSSFGRCHWHIAAILFSVYFCPWWRWVGWKLCYFPPFRSWLAHGYKRILFNSTTIHPVTTLLFSVELWMGIVFIKVSGKWHSIWFLLQQKTQWGKLRRLNFKHCDIPFFLYVTEACALNCLLFIYLYFIISPVWSVAGYIEKSVRGILQTWHLFSKWS